MRQVGSPSYRSDVVLMRYQKIGDVLEIGLAAHLADDFSQHVDQRL